MFAVTLREHAVEETAMLPDGRDVLVRLGLFEDSYLRPGEANTVTLDLVIDGAVEATVETVLEPEQASEARVLAREVAAALASGELAPTAGSIEHLALTIPDIA